MTSKASAQSLLIAIFLMVVFGGCEEKEKIIYVRDDENEIVKNIKTNRLWLDTNETNMKTYKEAKEYCNSLELGGYSDWRIPSKVTLIDWINNMIENPKNSQVFHYIKSYEQYWSTHTFYMGTVLLRFTLDLYGNDDGVNTVVPDTKQLMICTRNDG